jgi:cobalt-zinc-cadmium efflux system outer membrane protein
MAISRLAGAMCAALFAVPLAAQHPDSAARAKARADSVARVDSAYRADSIRVEQERARIFHEPRKHDSSAPPPLRLTRQEAIAMALANNPTVVMAREQMAQSQARVTQATAFPDPLLGFTVQGVGHALWPQPAAQTVLIAEVDLPFPQKFGLRGTVAEGDLGSYQAAYQLQRQQISLQTAMAYDSLLVSLKHRDDLSLASQLAADFLKKTQARFNAGTAARLDVVKAQVGVAQAANDLIANERGVANARAALNRLLGRVLGSEVEAADTLAVVPVPADFDRLERVAMERRPELFAVRKQIAAADAQHSLAQQYLLPDLQLSVNWNFPYGPAGGVPSNYTTGVSIDFPLLFWQHQNGEVAEAKHLQLELTATQKDVLAQVGQDLRNAYAAAVTSYRQAVFIRDELLPSAEEQYHIAFVTYSLGGSSALEVIDSQNTLLDARSQYAAALGALNDAVADLERAVGAPLDTTPTEPTHD